MNIKYLLSEKSSMDSGSFFVFPSLRCSFITTYRTAGVSWVYCRGRCLPLRWVGVPRLWFLGLQIPWGGEWREGKCEEIKAEERRMRDTLAMWWSRLSERLYVNKSGKRRCVRKQGLVWKRTSSIRWGKMTYIYFFDDGVLCKIVN